MLEVWEITKQYEGKPLLHGVSFSLSEGETLALLGPSGSGKSTLLRIIAGLEEAEGGQIFWNGEDLRHVPAHRRGFGLMFQDYALFPHLNVFENVAFGLRMAGLPREEVRQRVEEALRLVNMSAFANRRVTDLSGGEQQRVALARALAPRPRLLMLDEPLGALDRTLREELLEDLRHLLHTTRIPAIYVTHDQEEAFALADRLILLHEGKIEQVGTPQEVYSHPVSLWAARFLGQANVLPGRVIQAEPLVVETPEGQMGGVPADGRPLREGEPVAVLLQMVGVELVEPQNPQALFPAVVDDVTFRGDSYRVELITRHNRRLLFHVSHGVRVGETVGVKLSRQAIRIYREDGNQ
jgi:ABC-type Fe3+/spermidine/putrescine transport system ATPase subunit